MSIPCPLLRWFVPLLLVLLTSSVYAEFVTESVVELSEKRYRILMLLWRGETRVEEGFRSQILEHNLPFDLIIRSADQNTANIPKLVAEAKQLQPDLIYTWGTSVTLGTVGTYDNIDPQRYITDIPVVFTMVSYPLESRVVSSLVSSGRNVTGTTHIVPVETQINAIRAYRPMKRLAMLYNPTEPNSVINVNKLRQASQSMDFELFAQPIPLDAQGRPNPDTLLTLIDRLATREPQFFYLGPDTFIGGHRQAITRKALQLRLPVFAATERPIRDSDVTLGLVTSYFHLGRFAAYKAEQILIEGIAPDKIPVETLHRFSYLVKLPVARQLDLYPPLAILNYAEVLE